MYVCMYARVRPAVEVVIGDLMLPGPYTEVWSGVFSRRPHNVLAMMRDAALQQAGGDAEWSICFRRLVLPPPGIGAPICQHVAIKTQCRDTAYLQAAAEYIRRALGVRTRDEGAEASTDRSTNSSGGMGEATAQVERPQLTLIQRADYSAANRLTHGAIHNIDQVLALLHHEFRGRLRLRIVDFAQLSLTEQVDVAHSTNILLGAHGAGLTHLMWMRPRRAAVVELFTTFGEGQNNHYHNSETIYLAVPHTTRDSGIECTCMMRRALDSDPARVLYAWL
jgi:hypothetical protein